MNLGKLGQPCTIQTIGHERQTPQIGLPKFTQVCARGMTIQLVREKLEKYLKVNQLQTPQQIQNIIAHIYSLAQ